MYDYVARKDFSPLECHVRVSKTIKGRVIVLNQPLITGRVKIQHFAMTFTQLSYAVHHDSP